MNIGIGGMGGLQIGKEHHHLGIGTIGMVMMMMVTTLDIDEGGQVTVRDRGAESAKETRLVVQATPNMIHPQSDMEPVQVQALHLRMKAHTDRTITQELHIDVKTERIGTSDLVLLAVLLPFRGGGNDTALRNMHWMISVMNLSHLDRVRHR
jgi:hypothetical protein